MKSNFLTSFLFLMFIHLGNLCFSQLIFPNGTEKKLTTTLSVVYEETKIPFIYPKGKVTDLSWRVLSDSVPTAWFIMACMNGTCLGGVPQSGRFDNFTGLPDSIGFLKYHLDFKDVPGTAKLRFIIYDENLFVGDLDTVTFLITHVTNNAVAINRKDFKVTAIPNPSSAQWNIKGQCNEEIISASLQDVSGRTIQDLSIVENPFDFNITINNSFLRSGVYLLSIQTRNTIHTVRLLKN